MAPLPLYALSHGLSPKATLPGTVAVGIGLGVGEDGVQVVADLALRYGCEIVSTLPVVEEGWLGEAYQVGLTGRSISPDIYLALGISGAVEHMTGVETARMIVAVNQDATAPMMQGADVAVLGDCRDVLPWLLPLCVELSHPARNATNG
jgi:electron transfer flavoprotein alpha subunit